MNIQQGKQTHLRAMNKENRSLVILLLLLAGDIQMNPGPGNRSVFPCGTCDIPVTWSQEGVCCNNCSVWYHKSCEDLSSRNMSYLGRSSVIWHCCKCNSINVDSFTFNSFELNTMSSTHFWTLTPLLTQLTYPASAPYTPALIHPTDPVRHPANKVVHLLTPTKVHLG